MSFVIGFVIGFIAFPFVALALFELACRID
jgi:hypothetical protein